LALVSLAACGAERPRTEPGRPSPSSASTSSAPNPTPSSGPPFTPPTPTRPKPPGPSSTPQIPPPARDPVGVIPATPKAYAEAFVAAWVSGTTPALTELGTKAAVAQARTAKPAGMPQLRACRPDAGSTYCTFEGDEYTVTVRVVDNLVQDKRPQAVTEVIFH
jgi:hypothetical protein